MDDAVRMVASLVNQGDVEQAVALSEQILNSAPDHPEALYVAAGVFWRHGDRGRAIDLQRRLIVCVPAEPRHHTRLIQFLQETGDLDGALKAGGAAVKVCPPDPLLLNAHGLLEFNAGRTADSLATFDRAIRNFPNNATGHRNRSLPLLADGRMEEAVASFSKGLTPWTKAVEDEDDPPAENLSETYDSLANSYDANPMQQTWGKKTAGIVHDIAGGDRIESLLDVCCGTGAVGNNLTAEVSRLVGIDLSPGMLTQAQASGKYHDLIEADMIPGMEALNEQFHVLTCSCALYHHPELSNFFRHSARLLIAEGHLVFSVDPAGDDVRIGAVTPGEFAHSRAYLRELAAAFDFDEVSISIGVHRAYPGFWCVFRRRRYPDVNKHD